MTTLTAPTQPTASLGPEPPAPLACRSCGRPESAALAYVCAACFGPLEARYDLDAVAASLERDVIARRAPGIWRYAELLPVDRPPDRGLAVGSTPLVRAGRLG